MVWEEGPIHLKPNVSAEWGMPLILFRYEKSPAICKRMCNIYKNWTLASPLNDSSYRRPASVFTNCPRLCPHVTGLVGWFLPAPWVPMVANRSVKGSVRHMVLVFGESLSRSRGFFSLFDLVFMCWEPFFPCIRMKSDLWYEGWGGSLLFSFWTILHCYPRKKIDIQRDYRVPPGRAALKGRVL